MRLLVAEDDPGLRSVLSRALVEQGYQVDVAGDGEEALYLIGEHDYAVAVLDWRMPKVTGLEVVETLRSQQSALPVLMLTARDAPPDRVTGLDAGADDYLVKPFDLDELFARVRALLRRPTEGGQPLLRQGALVLDPQRQEVTVEGHPIAVTATERGILEVLLRASPGVATRKAIANHVWPDELDPIGSNTIDVHITRLRAKLANAQVRLVTVRGSGFRLESPE